MKRSIGLKKKVFLMALVIVLLIATAISSLAATNADDLSSKSSSQTSSGSSSVSSSNSSSGLSNEEADKILQEIKTAGDNGTLEAKLEELLQKAILTDNAALKEYVEYAKQAYQLQTQLDNINTTLKALCIKNPELDSINSQLQSTAKAGSVSVSDIENSVSSGVKDVLSGLDEDKASAILANVDNIDKLKSDPDSLSDAEKTLINAAIMKEAKEQGELDENQQKAADQAIQAAASSLMSSEVSKYSTKERSRLIEDSNKFAMTANNAKPVAPEQVVLADTNFRLTSAPIMYNDQILISLNDILQFVKAEVQYTDSNATLAIQSDKVMVEVTKGKNTGFINDKSTNLPAPVITFNGATYISVEFFAQAFSISYENLQDQGVFIMYGNLNQL